MSFSSNSLGFSHTFNPFPKHKIPSFLSLKVNLNRAMNEAAIISSITSNPAFGLYKVFYRAKYDEFFKKNNI
jgi:hypothetical protein